MIKPLLAADLFSVENLDVIGILGLGISGFGFLLTLMSFYLIYKEQKRSGNPRPGILSIIKLFMFVNIGIIVFIGIIGLPAISKNNQLERSNNQLEKENDKKDAALTVLNESSKLDSLAHENADPQTPDVSNVVTVQFIESYVASLDTLAAKTKGPVNDSLVTVREEFVQLANQLRSNKVTSEKAFERIMENKSKVAWAVARDKAQSEKVTIE